MNGFCLLNRVKVWKPWRHTPTKLPLSAPLLPPGFPCVFRMLVLGFRNDNYRTKIVLRPYWVNSDLISDKRRMQYRLRAVSLLL